MTYKGSATTSRIRPGLAPQLMFLCTTLILSSISASADEVDALVGEWASKEMGCQKAHSNSEFSGNLLEISSQQFDRDEYPCSILDAKRKGKVITLKLICESEEGPAAVTQRVLMRGPDEIEVLEDMTYERCGP